jgi:outer membrane cobalamin receptor
MRIPAAAVALSLLCSATQLAAQRNPGRERNLITQEEIEKSGAKSAVDAIRRLRGIWLTNRGVGSLLPTPGGSLVTRETSMLVLVDGARRGGLAELNAIPISLVQEIRYYPAEQAVTLFGSDLPFGAIEVVMKKE